ncbi:hypothetical protein ABT187_49725 [Streptomyces sp. NPDC001817]|uniref:hypothetical protein n=1 Tax=Streptomyces sp. NPDC001817 TaxID=3154398 RepID=UPI00331AECFC
MRLTRPALVTATTLVTLTSLSATAHATGDNDDNSTTKKCTVFNRGDLDNISCGPMIVGNSNITGQSHSVGLGAIQTQPGMCFTLNNSTSYPVGIFMLFNPVGGWVPGQNPPDQIQPGATSKFCTESQSDQFEFDFSIDSATGPLPELRGTVLQENGDAGHMIISNLHWLQGSSGFQAPYTTQGAYSMTMKLCNPNAVCNV